MADVIILGAGLTGLSAAYHLDAQGIEYNIFEKSDRAGGLLKSVKESGYIFDHTGHFLHVSDDGFKTFLDQTIGLTSFDIIQRRSAIFSHNVLTEYPFQMNLHGLPTDIIAECIEGFVKRNTRTKNPHTFYDWVLKHFGAGFGKHFFFPYNKKILSYDLKKVHPAWTGRFVPSTSLHNIIEGCFEKKDQVGVGYNSSFYYPKQGGIESIITSITQKISQPIRALHDVCSIDPVARTVHFTNGHQEQYKTLISTLPLNRLLTIIKAPSSATFTNAAGHLLHNSVVNINMGFNVPIPLDKHWIYFPEATYPFYRLGFWHNVSKSLTPLNHTAVYGEFSYLSSRTSADRVKKTVDQAISKTLDFLQLNPQHKTVEKVLHLEHAYVIYDTWREKHLHSLLASLEAFNIHSIGRYGAWKYSSMQEAYQDGKTVAATIKNTLERTTPRAQKGARRGRDSAAIL